MKHDHFYPCWKRYCIANEIEPVSLYELRHTYATRHFERGLKMTEAQCLLGHESLDITMKIYVHY